MLTKNIDYLRVNRRDIYEKLRSVESNLDKDIEILEAKSNALTLQKKINSKSLYIHSKYNPIDEAEKVVKQYEEQIKNSNHIIFFGAGLGYHIHMILEQYPHMTFSIFEPSSTVFYHYISNMNFHELPLKKLTNLYIQGNEATPTIYTTFSEELHRKKTLLLILPSYERIFEEEYNSFIEHVHQHVKKTSIDYKVTNNYEKRWTINSIKNLPKVLETPNIIQDIGEKPFKGKPALLVAAGPSLTEEIEHIRYIKENGLAYIFSVGSAINFLINEGIYPDAACAYDPTEKSSMVFDKVVEQNITSIPLIFGSSGGYENVARYPGPCIHMITNQDTVSSIFLKRKLESKTEVVADAPSIAVVTLQLLYRLGCSLVILVGQNLAYKDKKWYPEGLHYANSTVSKERLQEATVVNSVDGDQILTNLTFNSMRMQIEKYINLNPQTPVINTTVGGAKIEGTEFERLEVIIKERLTNTVVDPNWTEVNGIGYELSYTERQLTNMNQVAQDLKKHIEIVNRHLRLISVQKYNNIDKVEKQHKKLLKAFRKLQKNQFSVAFLNPMLRIQYDILTRKIDTTKYESDFMNKSQVITEAIQHYVNIFNKELDNIYPIYEELRSNLNTTLYKVSGAKYGSI